jgi:hypothetical protein
MTPGVCLAVRAREERVIPLFALRDYLYVRLLFFPPLALC